MKNTTKKTNDKIKIINSSFTGGNITKYSGINKVSKFLDRKNIITGLKQLFPTKRYNATKFSKVQVLLSVVLASLSGINRIRKIANFTQDPLIKVNLRLKDAINENKISEVLKKLGEKGARILQNYLLLNKSKYLENSNLTHITLDADSTVSTTYGNQEGAEKGFNTQKKGAKSYHPLLVFVSELKLLYHSWFRTGSAYTSNGIIDFLKEVKSSLPKTVTSIFFRADSGFFSGKLLDLLESFSWDYLIKVKLKNLKQLLENQTWTTVKGQKGVSICEFDYTTKSWNGKVRKFKAIRTVKEYVIRTYLGKEELIPIYEYACYVSGYESLNGYELHEIYKQRSESETWIEQIKNQVFAGKTLTDNFWANDILWQLSCFAYNLSIMMRNKHQIVKKQEHRTFKDWFILVPGRLVKSGRKIELKIYENYYCKSNWLEFENLLETV